MGFLSGLGTALTGAGVLGGGIAGGAGGKTSTTGSSTTTGSQTGTYGQTPTYDPASEGLRQQLIQSVLKNLGTDQDFSGYTASGLNTVNQGYDASQKALQQTLAARGLSYSPVAGTSQAQSDTSRIGQGVQFMNSVPLLQQQTLQQKLQQALQTFAANPYSVSGTQDVNSNQSQNFNQNTQTKPAGGFLGGLFQGIGGLGSLFAGL